MTESLLIHGGRVLSFAPGVRGDAVLVADGNIAAVGSVEELRWRAPRATPIDLRGAALLPGWVDTHTHFYELARRRAGVDLAAATTLDDLRGILRRHHKALPPMQQWVGGGGWDASIFLGARGFDRHLLDEIFPDRPVSLESRDLHTLWCNTVALSAAGVTAATRAAAGGEVGRGEDGQPNGLLYETAWDLVWRARPPEDLSVARSWILEAGTYAHSLGLTGVHCMEPMSTLGYYEALRGEGALPLRICFHSPLTALDDRIAAGIPSYRGTDPWLRWGGVKVFMDGSLGSRSAWMLEPYPDGTVGRVFREEDELVDILVRATRAGIAGSVHAIGDATVRRVVTAIERTIADTGIALFHRIEHAQCVRPTERLRIARANIACAVQPVHLADDAALIEDEWPGAAASSYPLRSLRDAGVLLGMGSDAPVAELDPLRGMEAAVARVPRGKSRPWQPQEALDIEDALAGYTVGAASLGGWNDAFGTIEPGKRADLTAVDDPLRQGQGYWRDARVRLTIVDGRVRYEALG